MKVTLAMMDEILKIWKIKKGTRGHLTKNFRMRREDFLRMRLRETFQEVLNNIEIAYNYEKKELQI